MGINILPKTEHSCQFDGTGKSLTEITGSKSRVLA